MLFRSPIEGKMLKEAGFIGIKLVANKDTRNNRLMDRDNVIDFSRLNHKTEAEIKNVPYDFIIDNNSDSNKKELTSKIIEIISKEHKMAK